MLPALPPLPMPAALLAGGAPDALVPACPRADGVADHTVRTHSGAGGNRRCYVCTCGTVWNQTRPASLQPGEDPVVVYTTRNDLNGRAPQPRTADGKGYRCRDCGELKKGHVCTKGGLSLSSPFPAPKRRAAGLDYKPDAARVQEQYADILQMGDDQNDSAVLAFLRKWDLKPSEATALYKNLSAMKQAQDQLTAIGALASTAQAPPAPPAPPVGVPVALDAQDKHKDLFSISIEDLLDNANDPKEGLVDSCALLDIDCCADCKGLLDDEESVSCACGKTKVHKDRLCHMPMCFECA